MRLEVFLVGMECLTGFQRLCCRTRVNPVTTATTPIPSTSTLFVDIQATNVVGFNINYKCIFFPIILLMDFEYKFKLPIVPLKRRYRCYWTGEGPTCDSWCKAGEYVAAESRKGLDGIKFKIITNK